MRLKQLQTTLAALNPLTVLPESNELFPNEMSTTSSGAAD